MDRVMSDDEVIDFMSALKKKQMSETSNENNGKESEVDVYKQEVLVLFRIISNAIINSVPKKSNNYAFVEAIALSYYYVFGALSVEGKTILAYAEAIDLANRVGLGLLKNEIVNKMK